MKHLTQLTILALCAAGLVACSSGKAQQKTSDEAAMVAEDSSGAATKEDNDKAMAGEDAARDEMAEPAASAGEPAIDGYCPVAYIKMGKPVKGSAEFAVERDGTTYYLVNAKAAQAFEANPDKFTLPFGEWGVTSLAKGKKVTADPTIFSVHNGAIYLFADEEAKLTFEDDPDQTIQMAREVYQDKAS